MDRKRFLGAAAILATGAAFTAAGKSLHKDETHPHFKTPPYLKPGDVVELGIDGLGSSKQTCVAFSK